MRSLAEAFLIAVSMYSAVPVPIVEWNDKNTKTALAFFPFVGILCAAAVFAVYKLCVFCRTGSILGGSMCFAASLLVTGGIHMDGFCDTADAYFSRRSKEEKLRIMKDPNCGPFAVLSVVCVVLIQCASYICLYDRPHAAAVMAAVYVMSRALSGTSVVSLPAAPTSSLARAFGEGAPRGVAAALVCEYIAAAAAAFVWDVRLGAAALCVTLGVYLWYVFFTKKQFGGITGDTAGWFLVICETAALLVTALVSGRI